MKKCASALFIGFHIRLRGDFTGLEHQKYVDLSLWMVALVRV